MALVYIPSQSPNAKVLSAGIAVLQGNNDLAFRLLLPLEADATLQPAAAAAAASLHASLSLAYEKLPDMQRAIEQRILEEQLLMANSADDVAIQQIQTKLWSLISSLNKIQLIEMRGSSVEADLQGWVDLALANQAENPASSITDWQKAYPDHIAKKLAISLLQAETLVKRSSSHQPLKGSVALLLPLSDEVLAATKAIKAGLIASATIDNSTIEIKPYPITEDDKTSQDITHTYDLAINDGANYVVIANQINVTINHPFPIPTLMLNASESKISASKNLYVLSLSLMDEALLIAKTAHDFGMQNLLKVSQYSATFDNLSVAFNEIWGQMTSQTAKNIKVVDDSSLPDIKSQINTLQPDMILIAGDASFARKVRPYLDITTPTFGFSSIYDGMPSNTLNAIRFTDMPWLLKPVEFSAYQAPAAQITQDVTSQRWFAIGADAYQILSMLNRDELASNFHGLTGEIYIDEQGIVTHKPSLGSFSNNGVLLEK